MGLNVPIVNAPMGGAAGGALAAAVSRGGGLGMIGMGSSATAANLSAELPHISGLARPFGIGLVHWVMAAEPALLEVALAAKPALLAVSFGEDWSWVQRAHDAGVPVAAQVADVTGARRAVDAGVDVVVARGADGGGHGEARVGTLPLLAEVLDEVTVPVLAAGGIASARGLAAVLAAGAAGAWLGTVFTTCTEAATSAAAREMLMAASSDETVTTRVFDVAQQYAWPATLPERVLRNDFVNRFDGREDLVDADARAALAEAASTEDYRVAPINAGQGVGMVRESRSAAEVIDRLCAGAEQLLRRWA
ncbi:nitronate monooxygenase [Mycolicibacterium sp. ND9-15]|uniref:NAD(P)H-dependent flavin oxidoreductase n=1 Tax=Mycolicibacterium sp. ND9-15 TaxID=3042320 RepID=UPI002DDBF1CF|nr:nitronate monooxygenase [Mycolicibacterium sp. ND9-15]WSE58703.1 nitronate monooxygenase [Mycolicibacterium sp. ND9-15]